MKFLLQVGHELDLNVNWDGGGVDNVTYRVSAGSEDVISVTSAGIVEGLVAGVGVVEFVSSGIVVGSAIFEVLTASAYTAQQGIRDGSKALVVDADSVPQGPPPEVQISLNTMASASQGGYTAFANDIYGQGGQNFLAFNGSVIGTDHVSFYVPNPGNTQFAGQILPIPKTLTRYEIKTSGNSDVQKWRIEGSNNTTNGSDGTWVTVDDRPSYTAWSGAMNVTTNFTVTNSTAYKAYRLTALHNSANPGGIWRVAELTMFGH